MATNNGVQPSGLLPYYDDSNIKAIIQLRKAIYVITKIMKPEYLYELKESLGIYYLELEGDNERKKTIFLLSYCQSEGLLNQLFSILVNDSPVPGDYFDSTTVSDIQTLLKSDINDILFDVPEQTTCLWRDPNTNKITHHPRNRVVKLANNPCTSISICQICGKVTHKETNHQWGEWRYVSDDSCEMIRECEVPGCGASEETTEHNWSGWIDKKEGSKYKVCYRCGKREFVILGTWQGIVEWDKRHRDLWRVTFYKKGFISRLFTDTINARIEVFRDLNETNDKCEYLMVQEANADIIGNRCEIRGKKITEGKKQNQSKALVSFKGKIDKECESISGSCEDKYGQGELVLTQI